MINKTKKTAVTLLELLVVVMILGILSTIAVTVYTGHVERARVAACRDIIRQIELAVNRYEVDTGQLPPSSSGLTFSPDTLIYEGNAFTGSFGCGYLQLALQHSLSGNFYRPLSHRWLGPYMEWDDDQLGDRDGYPIDASVPKGYVQFLDPWGMPFYYIKADHYQMLGGTKYPTDHPFYASETYYNPTSFQVFSTGRNLNTYPVPYRGEETDDVTNWRKYGNRYAAGGGGSPSGGSRNVRTTGAATGSGHTAVRNQSRSVSMDRPVQMAFPLGNQGGSISFQWPRGWIKNSNKVSRPSENEQPTWLFKSDPSVSAQSLADRYKSIAGAEVIYEGPDPAELVSESFVLEMRSEVCPEVELKEETEGKPYRLLFVFRQANMTCWWASSFSSWESMEDGRIFIAQIINTRSSASARNR